MLLAYLGWKLSVRVADINTGGKEGKEPLPSNLKKATLNVIAGRQAVEETDMLSRG